MRTFAALLVVAGHCFVSNMAVAAQSPERERDPAAEGPSAVT